MRTISSPSGLKRLAVFGSALLLAGGVGWLVHAQVGGERGIAPVAASQDIEVSGIEVDVKADTGIEAREEAWREAQVKAWEKIGGPKLPESRIAGLTSAIVIEQERLGPKRYVATLGVVFDRQRAGALLGEGGVADRSAPMLLLPVTVSGGTQLVYEERNPWQRAWAEFQSGQSRIDYVRPQGSGGESLLLTYGQTTRRSRVWWNNILDEFGAADVLVPIARLDYSYPGGPITGTFTARHGPDSDFLASFTLKADGPGQLPAMLSRAVKRFDTLFQTALDEGTIAPDPTLKVGNGDLDPAIQQLLDVGRRMRQQEQAREAGASDPAVAAPGTDPAVPSGASSPDPAATAFTVQFQSPDAGSFGAILAEVRSTAGVRSTAIRSTAIGGTSVMTVTYAGSLADLASALRARGFTVQQGSNALLISR